jgi:hypothetical protein
MSGREPAAARKEKPQPVLAPWATRIAASPYPGYRPPHHRRSTTSGADDHPESSPRLAIAAPTIVAQSVMAAVARIKADAVPSTEFRGKARDVRRQLITWRERYDPVMAEIATGAQKAYAGRTTTIPLRLLESTKVRWRALGRDACLFQSIELTGRHLRIQDVRFVASGAVHAPDPRMPHLEEHDTQAFCAMEFRLELKKREPRLTSRVMFGCALDADQPPLGFSYCGIRKSRYPMPFLRNRGSPRYEARTTSAGSLPWPPDRRAAPPPHTE